jgi:hypothetical protein
MTYQEALKSVTEKGWCITRPCYKQNGRYILKIIPVNRIPWIWYRTGWPGINTWTELGGDTLYARDKKAKDWKRCSRPS